MTDRADGPFTCVCDVRPVTRWWTYGRSAFGYCDVCSPIDQSVLALAGDGPLTYDELVVQRVLSS